MRTEKKSETRKTLVIGWSNPAADFEFLREAESLRETAACVLPPRLTQAVKTALSRVECIVVLQPKTAREHDEIEQFLLKIDRQNKINTHYVIVVSAQGKRFKSGVQSHSVVVTYDQDAILRAIQQGIVACAALRPAGQESDVEAAIESDEQPRKPSLLEYFKLRAFPRAPDVLASLAVDERERLAVALGEMNRLAPENASPGTVPDPLERAALFLRRVRSAEVAVLKGGEVVRFAPLNRVKVPEGNVPIEVQGVLPDGHPIYGLLGVPSGMAVRFFWVESLKVYILSWSANAADSAFAQALVYTVLRLRVRDRIRQENAA